MATHDLLIRGGTVVDGTGSPPRTADVAVTAGRVTEIGRIDGTAARVVDADGAVVTPGFIDIHTHYDGQVTWDSHMQPSSWHGVTTVVFGNCGVGFAPVRDVDHARLIELMEGVEDIPGTALHEGLPWTWNSFAEYLDAIDTPKDVDVGAQVPHGALRLHVMGERAAALDDATPDDIAEMAELAAAGVTAGGLGFTTSRTRNHRTSTGDYTPTLTAARDELLGIAEAVGATGRGVLQLVSDFIDFDDETETLRQMVRRSSRPLSFTLVQHPLAPRAHESLMAMLNDAQAEGLPIKGQVAARAIGLLLGFDCTLNPFMEHPAYLEVADLPRSKRVGALAAPERRSRLLAHSSERNETKLGGRLITLFSNMFELDDPPDYEPTMEQSLEARARREGRTPEAVALDVMSRDDGRGLIYLPFLNYADGNLDATREMLVHAHTVPGLGDGGAHVGSICDGSFPTTLLTQWGRDRSSGRVGRTTSTISAATSPGSTLPTSAAAGSGARPTRCCPRSGATCRSRGPRSCATSRWPSRCRVDQ